MSWEEYKELAERAQLRGTKHMFVLDLKGSRLKYKEDSGYMQKLNNLLECVYKEIKEKEKKDNKRILHRSKHLNKEGISADTREPIFFLGDLLVFTVIRGSISREEVYKIIKEVKGRLNMLDYEFHYADGYYETNEYSKGGKLFYRGYCIGYLENKAKKKTELI